MQNLNFAVVTRLQLCEMPFIDEFIEYYLKLGINKFYLINTEPQNEEKIRLLLKKFESFIELITNYDVEMVNDCACLALEFISEDFTLHVDMDEFLYLDGKNLQQFISNFSSVESDTSKDAFVFNWIMSPEIDAFCGSVSEIIRKRRFFVGNEVKTLAKTKVIKKIKNHRFDYKWPLNEINLNENDNCFVFHVSSRGILDIINRIAFSQIKDNKTTANNKEELRQLMNDQYHLPPRFLLLAFQQKMISKKVDVNFELPDLASQTDVEHLRTLSKTVIYDKTGVCLSDEKINFIRQKVKALYIPWYTITLYRNGMINFLTVIKILKVHGKIKSFFRRKRG